MENKPIPYNSPKNWYEPNFDKPESKPHGGCYQNYCYQCGDNFFGPKSAMICKECDAINQERSRMADEYPSLSEELKQLREEKDKLQNSLRQVNIDFLNGAVALNDLNKQLKRENELLRLELSIEGSQTLKLLEKLEQANATLAAQLKEAQEKIDNFIANNDYNIGMF